MSECGYIALDMNGEEIRLGDLVELDKLRTGKKFTNEKTTGIVEEIRFTEGVEPLVKSRAKLFYAHDVVKVKITDAQYFVMREFRMRGQNISLDTANAIIAAARLPETYPDYNPFAELEGEGNVAREGED